MQWLIQNERIRIETPTGERYHMSKIRARNNTHTRKQTNFPGKTKYTQGPKIRPDSLCERLFGAKKNRKCSRLSPILNK